MSPVFPSDIMLLHLKSVKYALPVDTLTETSPVQLTSKAVTVPVPTERSSSPADMLSMPISPVVVFILIFSEADAQKLTSPVLKESSTSLNVKSLGILTSPVLSLIKSEAYSVFGR